MRLRTTWGDDPVVSNLVWIEKKGKRGRRMIVNLKRSGVSAASRKTERVLLPRTLDSVWDLIELLLKKASSSSSSQQIDALVIDFVDAFWQVPLVELERKFTVSEHGGA